MPETAETADAAGVDVVGRVGGVVFGAVATGAVFAAVGAGEVMPAGEPPTTEDVDDAELSAGPGGVVGDAAGPMAPPLPSAAPVVRVE